MFLHEPLFGPPQHGVVEESIIAAVQWLRLAVEAAGAAVIAVGVIAAARAFVLGLAGHHGPKAFSEARLTLARYLALALELQLGADVLSTAIAPSWDQIGKLGAIAIIRTALNYFLRREVRED